MKKSPTQSTKKTVRRKTGMTSKAKSASTPKASESGLGPIFCAAYEKAGFKNPERMLADHDYCMRQEKLHPDKIFEAIEILGTMMSGLIAMAKSPGQPSKNKRGRGRKNGTSPTR